MPRKLVGYILLSFLSFCFFTVVFNILAIAQVSAEQTTPPIIDPELVNPTPTIYNSQEPMPVQSNKIVNSSTPTPTIFKQQTSTTTTPSQENMQLTETPVPPTATPTPSDIPTVTLTPSPQPTIATTTDLETLFSKYSAQYSVSEDELKKIANCESGQRIDAQNGDYLGMFQFGASTWASTRSAMGLDPNPDLRTNAEEAIKTTAFMLSRGEQNAWPNCH
jgi:hypothetical protein